MDCPEFLSRYSDWRDGLVTAPREQRRFARHVARCTACADYDAVVRRGVLALHAVAHIEPSRDFRRRLDARLAAERGAGAEPTLSPRAGLAAALCVAAAMALVVLEGVSQRTRATAATPELPPVIFPKPVTNAGVPLVTFHDPRATVLGGNPNPYGTALVQPASTPGALAPNR